MLNLFKKAKNEEGYALLVVIGIFAIALLVTALLAAQILSMLNSTTGSKASLQAEANAEAGVSRAQQQLVYPGSIADTCVAGLRTADTSTAFKYDETIYWTNSLTEPTSDAQWTVLGCADTVGYTAGDTIQATTVKFVRVKVTGHAQNPGTTGYSAFNDRKVDAVFAYKNLLGTAAYSAGDLTGVNGNVVLNVGNSGTLYVNGVFNCNGSSVSITANVFASGNASASGSCTITGDLTSNATATAAGSGNVLGAVTSNSPVQFPSMPTPYIYPAPGYAAGSSSCSALTASVVVKTYFDHSACSTAGTVKNINLAISADTTIYLRNPTAGNPTQDLTVTSADGLKHNLWLLIISGPAAATEPACTGNKNYVFSTFAVDPKISTMVYDPCQPVFFPSGTVITGQLVDLGLGITGGNTLTVNYTNVGIPGVSSIGPATAALNQTSYRNTN
jgi:hypothetical protein